MRSNSTSNSTIMVVLVELKLIRFGRRYFSRSPVDHILCMIAPIITKNRRLKMFCIERSISCFGCDVDYAHAERVLIYICARKRSRLPCCRCAAQTSHRKYILQILLWLMCFVRPSRIYLFAMDIEPHQYMLSQMSSHNCTNMV